MCNSSLQIDNSTSMYDKTLIWKCICQGYFGTVLIIIITALFFIVGTPIHCWSLWVFLHGNIKPNLVFPLNITLQELVYCFLCSLDLIITNYFSEPAYKLAMFLIGVSWTVRPLLQICMCTEHYLAVIHPVTFLRYKGIQCRITLAAAAWLTGVGNGLRIIFIDASFFPDHIFFLFFCIAVITTSFCCASVLRALKHPGPGKNVEMTEKDRHNKMDRGRAVKNQQKRKAFRIISHILVSILICYLPLVITYVMNIAKINVHLYSCTVSPLVLSITMTTVLISLLVRMYNDGHMKHRMCFSKLKELIKGK